MIVFAAFDRVLDRIAPLVASQSTLGTIGVIVP